MQKCTLSFKSFRFLYIKNSIDYIYQTLIFWGIPVRVISLINKPTKRKKYTFLRSPHIDKKSREQFEWVKKKTELILIFKDKRSTLFLLFWLENSQFPGVQLTISLTQVTKIFHQR